MDAIVQPDDNTDNRHGTTDPWASWLDENELARLEGHPLLRALARGSVDIGHLRTTLIQHHHYSRHFTRYLCALISRLGSMEDIDALIGNLLEEMGIDGENKITHAELYQRSMRVVGAEASAEPPLEPTNALVKAMIAHCRADDPTNGLAALCLGAEAIVPIVYRPILAALRAHGFGHAATEFFELHIEEDEDHALAMLAILERRAAKDPAVRARAIAIGSTMIRHRAAMFDAIWERAGITTTRGGGESRAFSSGDFGRVPARLHARLPDRLLHREVASAKSDADARFSGERAHAVHMVDLPTHSLSMTIGRLDAGQSTRLHRHNYETVIYVVAGCGHSDIGDRIVEWRAGDAFYVPVWAAHRHVGGAEGECVYIACENAPQLQNMGGIALREELDMA